ncbi:MAG: TolC family protein, partial [Opitutales bacterium]
TLANAFEDRQGEEWSVGFLLKMDLERRAPRATVRVAQRQLFQARVELSKALRSVALEIDTALQRTESAEQRLTTAEEAAALAAKRLEQELQALEQGKGDLYRVVEQQQILGDTEVEVAATRAFLRKATVALWMSSGQVFERLGVEQAQIRALLEEPPSGIDLEERKRTAFPF